MCYLQITPLLSHPLLYNTLMQNKLNTKWFFTEVHPLLKVLGIFVKGDALALAPYLVLTFVVLLLNLKLGLIMIAIYYGVRGLGEMIYWLLQQFGPKAYRPYDYGLTSVSNEGIYVIYQLTSTLQVILSITVSIYLLFPTL